ncbi:hypothetical protein IFM89_023268 [Coptis chinensis]|uniref:DUF4283 domain-containing protein n=1 Tax=Coptis chinensis TaxID=261450 RepID=A0A835LW79_9MAGN|nr:hypothetical protein IFM89_023268 [Coptis chinensis]
MSPQSNVLLTPTLRTSTSLVIDVVTELVSTLEVDDIVIVISEKEQEHYSYEKEVFYKTLDFLISTIWIRNGLASSSSFIYVPQTVEVTRAPITWSSLFSNRRSSSSVDDGKLEWFDISDVEDVVEIPTDILNIGTELWKDYLVGFFADKRIIFPLVKKTLERVWKTKASYEISTNRYPFYFKFLGSSDRKLVLEGGPLFVAGRIFMIKPWSEDLDIQNKSVGTLPICVKLHNISKQLWTKKGVSFIASRKRKPHCWDEATQKKQRLDFAKVCVEVPVNAKYLTSLKFKLGLGRDTTVTVEYVLKLLSCVNCSKFGNNATKCPQKSTSTTWIRRPTTTTTTPQEGGATGPPPTEAEQETATPMVVNSPTVPTEANA